MANETPIFEISSSRIFLVITWSAIGSEVRIRHNVVTARRRTTGRLGRLAQSDLRHDSSRIVNGERRLLQFQLVPVPFFTRNTISAPDNPCRRAFSTASSRMFRCAFSAIRRQEPNGNTTHSSSMQNSMRPKALPPRPAPPETPSAATDRKQSLFPARPRPPQRDGQPPLPADASSSEERIRRQKRLSEGALPGRMRFAFIVTFVRCKSARSRNSGSGRGTP